MTDDNWRAQEKAFEQALALTPDQRQAFLAQLAHEDPELAEQLQRLIDADSESDLALNQPIADSLRTFSEEQTDHWIGQRLGIWHIEKHLAEGGMGSVYLATRSDDQYQQTVALKIMGSQLQSDAAKARFRSERQILANLNHPFIAKLLDGGSTDSGLPYLVMEFVEGLPLDKYCEAHTSSINERLQLIRNICEAVDYAHRNLVVHRDLKPSNILVDANGMPKLLDFGIAKLLSPQATESTAGLTQAGIRPMTPEYASPEQVLGQPVSVASDVYALGVLLYHLITGCSPYRSTSDDPLSLQREIVELEPTRPSTRVQHTPASEPDTRQYTPLPTHRLTRKLTGDLDNIALTCLQKDPQRRYPTARALSDDLDNYLNGRPVSARGAAWTYRAGKFLRRNATIVAMTACLIVAGAGLTFYYTYRLALERDIASQERAAAEQVVEFLVNIFSANNPNRADAATISVRDVLDRGADQMQEDMRDHPLIEARLQRHIGWVYRSLGLYESAETAMARSLALIEQHEGTPDELAETLFRYSTVNVSTDQFQAALAQLGRALATAEQSDTPDEQLIYRLLRLLSYVEGRLGNRDRATAYTERLLEHSGRIFTESDVRYGNALYIASTSARQNGEPERAHSYATQALELALTHYGPEAVETANYHHQLGLCLWDLARYEQALGHYRKGLAYHVRLKGDAHPDTFPIRFSIAATLSALERIEEAVAQYQSLTAHQSQTLGEDSPALGFTLGGLGLELVKLERFEEAELALSRSKALLEAEHGSEHPDLSMAIIGLGHIDKARGNYQHARERYERALALRTRAYGETHGLVAKVLVSMAELELEAENRQLAYELFSQALTILDSIGKEDSTERQQLMARMNSI